MANRNTTRVRPRYARVIGVSFCLMLLSAALAADRDASAKDKPQVWKSIDDALLRINDAPPKEWNVYQTGKKSEPLLLQWGNRFLLIQSRTRQIFELDPSTIEHKPDQLLWSPSDKPSQPLATSDWQFADNGGAFELTVNLDAEKASVDLQLPHPQDVGDLPVRGPNTGAGRRR